MTFLSTDSGYVNPGNAEQPTYFTEATGQAQCQSLYWYDDMELPHSNHSSAWYAKVDCTNNVLRDHYHICSVLRRVWQRQELVIK